MAAQPEEVKWYVWAGGILISVLSAVFGAGMATQRFKENLSKLNNTVFDDKGVAKIVTISTCADAIEACQSARIERRDSFTRELQNIHAAIAFQSAEITKMNQALAAMPATVAKEWKEMGLVNK